jgi:hypothetical protein
VSVLSSQFIIGSWIWTDSLNCDFIFHDYLFMCKFFAQMEWFSVSKMLFWCDSLHTSSIPLCFKIIESSLMGCIVSQLLFQAFFLVPFEKRYSRSASSQAWVNRN